MLQHCARSRNRPRKRESLLYFGCDFSGWYNFEKVIKILAIRCHILKLGASNSISAGLCRAPDHAGRAYSAPQTLWVDLRGPTSKGKEGRGRESERKGKERT